MPPMPSTRAHVNAVAIQTTTNWRSLSSGKRYGKYNAERKCYRDRQAKDTGARIVRLRTYDANAQRVFVEHKVHHERWTVEQSSKDRFTIDEQQIMQARSLCAFPLKVSSFLIFLI